MALSPDEFARLAVLARRAQGSGGGGGGSPFTPSQTPKADREAAAARIAELMGRIKTSPPAEGVDPSYKTASDNPLKSLAKGALKVLGAPGSAVGGGLANIFLSDAELKDLGLSGEPISDILGGLALQHETHPSEILKEMRESRNLPDTPVEDTIFGLALDTVLDPLSWIGTGIPGRVSQANKISKFRSTPEEIAAAGKGPKPPTTGPAGPAPTRTGGAPTPLAPTPTGPLTTITSPKIPAPVGALPKVSITTEAAAPAAQQIVSTGGRVPTQQEVAAILGTPEVAAKTAEELRAADLARAGLIDKARTSEDINAGLFGKIREMKNVKGSEAGEISLPGRRGKKLEPVPPPEFAPEEFVVPEMPAGALQRARLEVTDELLEEAGIPTRSYDPIQAGMPSSNLWNQAVKNGTVPTADAFIESTIRAFPEGIIPEEMLLNGKQAYIRDVLDPKLTPVQRAARFKGLHTAFMKEITKKANSVITKRRDEIVASDKIDKLAKTRLAESWEKTVEGYRAGHATREATRKAEYDKKLEEYRRLKAKFDQDVAAEAAEAAAKADPNRAKDLEKVAKEEKAEEAKITDALDQLLSLMLDPGKLIRTRRGAFAGQTELTPKATKLINHLEPAEAEDLVKALVGQWSEARIARAAIEETGTKAQKIAASTKVANLAAAAQATTKLSKIAASTATDAMDAILAVEKMEGSLAEAADAGRAVVNATREVKAQGLLVDNYLRGKPIEAMPLPKETQEMPTWYNKVSNDPKVDFSTWAHDRMGPELTSDIPYMYQGKKYQNTHQQMEELLNKIGDNQYVKQNGFINYISQADMWSAAESWAKAVLPDLMNTKKFGQPSWWNKDGKLVIRMDSNVLSANRYRLAMAYMEEITRKAELRAQTDNKFRLFLNQNNNDSQIAGSVYELLRRLPEKDMRAVLWGDTGSTLMSKNTLWNKSDGLVNIHTILKTVQGKIYEGEIKTWRAKTGNEKLDAAKARLFEHLVGFDVQDVMAIARANTKDDDIKAIGDAVRGHWDEIKRVRNDQNLSDAERNALLEGLGSTVRAEVKAAGATREGQNVAGKIASEPEPPATRSKAVQNTVQGTAGKTAATGKDPKGSGAASVESVAASTQDETKQFLEEFDKRLAAAIEKGKALDKAKAEVEAARAAQEAATGTSVPPTPTPPPVGAPPTGPSGVPPLTPHAPRPVPKPGPPTPAPTGVPALTPHVPTPMVGRPKPLPPKVKVTPVPTIGVPNPVARTPEQRSFNNWMSQSLEEQAAIIRDMDKVGVQVRESLDYTVPATNYHFFQGLSMVNPRAGFPITYQFFDQARDGYIVANFMMKRSIKQLYTAPRGVSQTEWSKAMWAGITGKQHSLLTSDARAAEAAQRLKTYIEQVFDGPVLNALEDGHSMAGRMAVRREQVNRHLKRMDSKREFTGNDPNIPWSKEWTTWDDVTDFQKETVEMLDAVLRTGRENSIWGNFRSQLHYVGKDAIDVSHLHPILEGHTVHPAVAKELTTLFRNLNALDIPANAAKWLRTYDKALNFLKAGLTLYRPAYYAKSLMGDMFISWMDGLSPLNPKSYMYYSDSWSLMRNAEHLYPELNKVDSEAVRALELINPGVTKDSAVLQGLGLKGAQNTKYAANKKFKVKINGKTEMKTGAEIFEMVYSTGALKRAHNLTDLDEDVLQFHVPGTVGSKLRGLGDAARTGTEMTDHFARLAHILYALEHPYKGTKAISFEEAVHLAVRRVKTKHPDGTELTRWEKAVPRRLMPFYAWTRRASPQLLLATVTNTRVSLLGPRLSYASQQAYGMDTEFSEQWSDSEDAQEWMTSGIVGPLAPPGVGPNKWLSPGGGSAALAATNSTVFPNLDILNTFAGSGDPLSSIGYGLWDYTTPAIKNPVEFGFGHVFATHQDIGYSEGRANYVSRNIPIWSDINRLFGESLGPDISQPESKKDQPLNLSVWLNYLMGVGGLDTARWQ